MMRRAARIIVAACGLVTSSLPALSACAAGDTEAADARETRDGDGGLIEPDTGGSDAGEANAGAGWQGEVRSERSLVWTWPELLDDPAAVGLGRVLDAAAAALETTPGALLDAWLRRFATTPHSERAAPARLANQLALQLGEDVDAWDVDLAPFRVTGVHNRIDLLRDDAYGQEGQRTQEGHCGELRVSLASTDPLIRPFHALFLFRQPALEGDRDAAGGLTCAATALRWAELSKLEPPALHDAARAILDEGMTAERFIMIETVELTVSPWEWRQWVPTSGATGVSLENPPLFQQVDTDAINAPGPLRDAFLAFVEENAAALDARGLLIPAQFRPRARRVAQGVTPAPLDLEGVSPEVRAAWPQLRQHIEIVGCAACHTADAAFVQTRDDRTLSPFYTKELVARAALLHDILQRRDRVIPYGPLQAAPILP